MIIASIAIDRLSVDGVGSRLCTQQPQQEETVWRNHDECVAENCQHLRVSCLPASTWPRVLVSRISIQARLASECVSGFQPFGGRENVAQVRGTHSLARRACMSCLYVVGQTSFRWQRARHQPPRLRCGSVNIEHRQPNGRFIRRRPFHTVLLVSRDQDMITRFDRK